MSSRINHTKYDRQAQNNQALFNEWNDTKVKWRDKWQNKLLMLVGSGLVVGFPVYLVIIGY